ncbi:MAG TPA: response regulator [Chitinophagales bacterium]|nr:response regulator [Chitinophagales bacterium]
MKKSKILFIADDDQDDIELFMEAVNEIDGSIQCYSAIDGEDALKKLRDMLPGLPDIIFLDLNMPRINGKQCLAEIKKIEKLSGVAVVIYSTSSIQHDIDEARKLGAACFLTKPSSFSELCKELSNIISSMKPLLVEG